MPMQVKPSLLERLQNQVAALERETSFLRQVDGTMRLRVQRAVAENDGLKQTLASQSATIVDLRRQLELRALELTKLRAEVEVGRSTVAAAAPRIEAPATAPANATRFDLLEVDT